MSRRRRRPAPLGTTEIVDLASDGRGVGRVDGKAVFVSDALPGEQVVFRPVKQKRDYSRAELVTLMSASTNRVTPRCEHFGVCGGCVLQHAAGDAQVQFKEAQLCQALERVGGVRPARVLEPLVDARWHYRRRARLGVKHVPKKGGVLVGFRERGSALIAPLRRCHVLIEAVGERLLELARLVESLSIIDRVPQIEVAAADNATALVFRVLDTPSAADIDAFAAFGRRHGLSIYQQPGDETTIAPIEPDVPALYYDLPAFDVRLYCRPADFVQIHAGVNEKMVARAIDALAVEPTDVVLDLFAGIGNFTLALARLAARVIAVEGEHSLVECARANAVANGLDNVVVQCADLFAPGAAPAWAETRCDKAIIDPPRAGAAHILSHLAAMAPATIVYCSCHPATLARDAGALVQAHGYDLVAAGVMDMFPHTAHVESMAIFEKRCATSERTDGN